MASKSFNAAYGLSVGTTAVVEVVSANGDISGANANLTGSAQVTGNVAAGNFTGANLVSANYVSGVLTTATQPNVTAVGNLVGLRVTGPTNLVNTVVTGNLSFTGDFIDGPSNVVIYQGNTNTFYGNFNGNVTGNIDIPGANTGIVFKDGAGANSTGQFTFDKGNNNVYLSGHMILSNGYYVGNGIGLTAVQGSNVTGQVPFAAVANLVAGANVSGVVANANYAVTSGSTTTAVTVSANAQPNITSVGVLQGLTVAASQNLSVASVVTPADTTLSVLSTRNITLTATSNGTSNTGNIDIHGGNATAAGQTGGSLNIYAGDANLTDGIGGATTLQSGNGNVSGDIFLLSANGVSIGGDVFVAGGVGNIRGGNVNITAGDTLGPGNVGASITIRAGNGGAAAARGQLSLSGANVLLGAGGNDSVQIQSNAVFSRTANLGGIANVKISGGANNYTIITDGAGNLSWVPNPAVDSIYSANSSIVVTDTEIDFSVNNLDPTFNITTATSNSVTRGVGAFYGDMTITGNLTVSGNTNIANVTTIQVTDPLIALGTGPSGGPLPSDDGIDRGIIMHTYGNGTVDKLHYMGWENGDNQFAMASNVTFANNNITINELGNLLLNDLLGNVRRGNTAMVIDNAPADVGNGNIGFRVAGSANIMTVSPGNVAVNGNLSVTGSANLALATVTGNITAGNVQGGNLVGANFLAGTLITGAQPNITALGILDSVTTVGNITALNVDAGNLMTANYVSGTLITGAQPNITAVGTLTTLTVSGAVNAASLTTTGNVSVGNNLSVTGNISANNFTGNFTGNIVIPGANTQVLFNTNDAIDAIATFTFDKASNVLTVAGNISSNGGVFLGNGAGLTQLAGANVLGTVPAATVAGTVTVAAQPNITAVGTLSSLTVTGNANVGAVNAVGNVAAQGNVSGDNFIGTEGVYIANSAILVAQTTTTSTAADQIIARVPFQLGRAVEFLVKGSSTTLLRFQAVTALAVAGDAATVNCSIWGTVFAGGELGNINVISTDAGSNIALVVTPSTASSTIWSTQYRYW